MPDFEETPAKVKIRDNIFNFAKQLHTDQKFSYLGLPGRECKDIEKWASNIRSAHCCEIDSERFNDMSMKLPRILPGKVHSHATNIWDFLKKSGELDEFIDLVNLDFCGGVVTSEAPEISELDALYNFFRDQKIKNRDKSFIITWTLGVRNSSIDYYVESNLGFAKGVFEDLKYSKLEEWLTSQNKMIRNYFLYIPCMLFQKAKSLNYRIELCENWVYKKTMYFSLFKINPSSKQITDDEYNKFVKDIFTSNILITDSNIDTVELLSIPPNILY